MTMRAYGYEDQFASRRSNRRKNRNYQRGLQNRNKRLGPRTINIRGFGVASSRRRSPTQVATLFWSRGGMGIENKYLFFNNGIKNQDMVNRTKKILDIKRRMPGPRLPR